MQISPTYTNLRDQIFSLSKDNDFMASIGNTYPIAILMETGFENGSYSLVAVSDGSVSIYFSNGGGIIGAGEHPEVREIALKFIELSKDYTNFLKQVSEYPLPGQGKTRFYVIGKDSVQSEEFGEDDLGNSRLPLSPLFLKGHELISAIRLIEEQREQTENQ